MSPLMSVALMLANSSLHRTDKSQVAQCQTGKHPDNDLLLRPMTARVQRRPCGVPATPVNQNECSDGTDPRTGRKKIRNNRQVSQRFYEKWCRAASAVFGCLESRHMLSASITQKAVNKPVLLSGILAPSGGNSKELRRDLLFAENEGQVQNS